MADGCSRTIREAAPALDLTRSESSDTSTNFITFPKGLPVRNSRYSDDQIEDAVRQAEAGSPVAEIVCKLGISEATLHAWKKRIEGLGAPDIRQLHDANAQLKELIANLKRDRQVCRTCATAAST
jgi:putative transposase